MHPKRPSLSQRQEEGEKNISPLCPTAQTFPSLIYCLQTTL